MLTYIEYTLYVIAILLVPFFIMESISTKRYYEDRNKKRRYQQALTKVARINAKLARIESRKQNSSDEELDRITKELEAVSRELEEVS